MRFLGDQQVLYSVFGWFAGDLWLVWLVCGWFVGGLNGWWVVSSFTANGYANCNAQGQFGIFFIYSDLLNCLRSVCTVVIRTTKMAKIASKSSPQRKSSLQATIFSILIYSLYGHPKKFKLKQEYQRPVFPFLMTMVMITKRITRSLYMMLEKLNKDKKVVITYQKGNEFS